MLATCLINGWPTETYQQPDHPLQQTISGVIASLTGESIGHVGVDGCGARRMPCRSPRSPAASPRWRHRPARHPDPCGRP